MQLDHPNVVHVHGGCLITSFGTIASLGSQHFIVEELCACNLDQYMYKGRNSPLPLEEVLKVRFVIGKLPSIVLGLIMLQQYVVCMSQESVFFNP